MVGSLVVKERKKMVMEMMFWFVVVVGMEEYMEGRLVDGMVEEMVVYGGWKGENGQPKGCFLLLWTFSGSGEGRRNEKVKREKEWGSYI